MKALIHENAPLAPLTTIGIGGPARYLIDAPSESIVIEAIHFAHDLGLPIFVLGGGSNLLVADRGFPGIVVRVGITGIDYESDGGKTIVRAGAGEEWDRLVGLCVDRDLAGVECLSGIPGSVGGTPVQNVGAYGQEVSDVLVKVRAYDRRSGSVVELSHDDCGFKYRASLFNTTARERYVVLQVSYALLPHGTPALRYADVRREFEGETSSPTLTEVREAVRRIRARKAMLLVEGDPDCRSAGSFFKNPIISEQQFADLQTLAGSRVPRYPASAGKVKTAAAWLIEHSGFSRGYSLGRAGLSSKHTLAVVNKGDAAAEDVLNLARTISNGVHERFGIRLVPEPVFLGFESHILAEFFPAAVDCS